MSEQKNDRRLEELTALVGGLAHEIKNPLSTISINLELLREDWVSEGSPLGHRSVAKIDVVRQEAQRLEKMLAEFLRIVSPGDLDLEPVNLNALLDEILVFVTPQLKNRNINVLSQCDLGIPAVVADRNLMKQVVLNLVKNAEEAIGESGGTLTLQTSMDDDWVILDVIDSGAGMSSHTMERIFQAYYSTKSEGTGLGLAMARRIVERHGGELRCESELHKGTRFHLALPFHGPDGD